MNVERGGTLLETVGEEVDQEEEEEEENITRRK